MKQRLLITLNMPSVCAEHCCPGLQLYTVDNYSATKPSGISISSAKACINNSLSSRENALYQAGTCV